MLDPEADKALRTVAAYILADKSRNNLDWDEYPEIGEDDWFALCRILNELTPFPPADQYRAAYDLLTDRANRDV